MAPPITTISSGSHVNTTMGATPRPNIATDGGSSLSYDFTGGSLPSGTTLTRASTGNYFNSSGVLSSAANDTARFDYNPSTLVLKGVLIEAQTENIVYPSLLNATWSAGGLTRTANDINGLNGVKEATRYTENTNTGTHYAQENANAVVVASGTSYTYSIHVKYSNLQWVQLVLPATQFGTTAYANFDIQNGVVGNIGAVVSATSLLSLGGDWYRISITVPAIQAGNASAYLVYLDSNTTRLPSYTGTSRVAYAWAAQVEAGLVATSYVSTTTTTATRMADALSFTIPSGIGHLTYTFDDNSTQVVAVSAGAYTVPTNLNRPWIKTIVGSA